MKSNLTYVRRLALLVSVLILGFFVARTLIDFSLQSLLGVATFIIGTFFLAEKVRRFEALSLGVFMGFFYFLIGHFAAWLELYVNDQP